MNPVVDPGAREKSSQEEVMTMTRGSILLGALCCIALTRPMKAADACPELQGKDLQARLEYLRGDRSKLAPKCVVTAIKSLGGKRYPQDSAVLIQYLDYHEPDYQMQGGLRASIPYVYPAVDALHNLGKSVIPELIAVITSSEATDLVRRNAGWAIFMMYGANQPEGIAVFVTAAHAQTDPIASVRLMDQARWFAGKCLMTSRNDCENAVLK